MTWEDFLFGKLESPIVGVVGKNVGNEEEIVKDAENLEARPYS